MADATKKQKLMTKRRYMTLVFQRLEDPNTPVGEFYKLALIAERNSRHRWRRKKRRSSDEVAFEKIRELERRGRLQRMKGTQ